MHWLVYAILSPIIASSTNYIEKYLLEKELDNTVVFTIFVGLCYLLFSIPIFLFHGIVILPFLQMACIILAGILNTFYVIPYLIALKLDETSRVVPLFQFVPIATLILSSLFLGEHLTNQQFLGFVLILCGGFFISIKTFDTNILKPRKALWYMMLSSVMYAILAVSFKYVVVKTDFWTTFSYEVLGSGIAGLLLLCIPRYARQFFVQTRKLSKIFYGGLLINMGLNILFEFFSALAISLAPVALVIVLGGIQPFVVLIIGIILSIWFPHIIEEDIQRKTIIIKLASLILIFIGTLFIYL